SPTWAWARCCGRSPAAGCRRRLGSCASAAASCSRTRRCSAWWAARCRSRCWTSPAAT
ncbi:unnamed protein product, partial [Effrenium voratum]